ncbi:MAG: CrcB family protein [Acidimicrobiales bacterium]
MPESTGTTGQPYPHAAHPHHGPGPMAALAVGGALGTLARYGIERAVPPPADGIPWATFAVNVAGSLLLGVVVTLVVERWPGDRYLRPLLAVGFCGGFTTFSTMAVEIDQRIQHGHPGIAVTYVAVTLVAGLGAALAGITLARGRLLPAVVAAEIPDPDVLAGDDPDDWGSEG